MSIYPRSLCLVLTVMSTSSCGGANPTNTAQDMSTTQVSNDTAETGMAIKQVKTKEDESKVMDTAPPREDRPEIPDCASLQSKSYDEAADLFEKYYPSALINPETVDTVSLSAEEMDAVAAFAACAAAKTDFEPAVADSALALFTSKKHSAVAFAALEKRSRNPGFEGKAAKEFAEQMRAYAKGPSE